MAEPTLADVLARLDKLERRLDELAAHEHDHHHGDHEHAHDDAHAHAHGDAESAADCGHVHRTGCACGFEERRVVDLIVDLVEERVRRVLGTRREGHGGPPGSGPMEGPPWMHGHGHHHGHHRHRHMHGGGGGGCCGGGCCGGGRGGCG